MLRSRHQELHEFVKEQAGVTYRSSFYYTADDWQTIHLRRDLEQPSPSKGCPDVVQRARSAELLVRHDDAPAIGNHYASTEIHDEAIVIHFPEDDSSGVVISLDPAAARLITGFVTRCLSILQIPESTKYQRRAAE